MRRILALLTVACWAVLIGIISLGSEDSQAADPVAAADKACLKCHDYYDESLAGTGHTVRHGGAGAQVSCTGCHVDAGEAHMEDPDENLPGSLTTTSALHVAEVCTQCHADAHPLGAFERDPHIAPGVRCTDCHQVHNAEHGSLLKQNETDLCLKCHAQVRSDFSLPYHHPVNDDVVKCSDCHTSIAGDHKQGVYSGPTAVCVTCHAEYRGPFPFDHPAAVDYSTQEGGCLNCHAPHGSTEPRMLKQSYEAPNYALCSQCHFQPGHQFNANHGDMWADMACNECHTDVHGSFTSRRLFAPWLSAEGCINGACHKL